MIFYLVIIVPMKRWEDPREVAEMVVFLASDKSSYISGTAIHIVAGLSTGL